MRPDRRMPRTSVIARHHDRPDGECWRCGACGAVERAHLIDRMCGGLDGPQNLSLLCGTCHRLMAMYSPGQEQEAKAYAMPASPGPSQFTERLIELVGREAWDAGMAAIERERLAASA